MRRAYRRTVEEQRLDYQFWLTLILLAMGFVLICFRPELFNQVAPAGAVLCAWWFGKGGTNGNRKDEPE